MKKREIKQEKKAKSGFIDLKNRNWTPVVCECTVLHQ